MRRVNFLFPEVLLLPEYSRFRFDVALSIPPIQPPYFSIIAAQAAWTAGL
jgi:hypothetical protein